MTASRQAAAPIFQQLCVELDLVPLRPWRTPETVIQIRVQASRTFGWLPRRGRAQ